MRRVPLPVVALLLAVSLAAIPALAKPQPAPPLAGLDAFVTRTMKEFGVPGMAVAVVKDGRVVLAKGYGVRRAGESAPVDADTLFGIASNTKAFTCAALSILVEEGKLAWDDPVTKHLPDFQMHDPWVTREVTVRDLVTHRAGLGLGGGDLMWWPPTTFTRREIVRGLRWVKPASSLRSRYAYNNVTFVAAGEVVAAVAGESWDDFVRRRLLEPIGMSRTTTRLAVPAGNLAFPQPRGEGRGRAGRPDGLRQRRRGRRHRVERLRHGALARHAARVQSGEGGALAPGCRHGRGRGGRPHLRPEAGVDPPPVVGPDRAGHARPAAGSRGPEGQLRRVRPRLRLA
jgi:CubicO group peptidase (beta-lactamase class C family)